MESGKASLMFKLRFEIGVRTKQGKGYNVHVCERMYIGVCDVCVMGGWAGGIREHSRKYKRALWWEDA